MVKTVSLLVLICLYQFPSFFNKHNLHYSENGDLISVFKNTPINAPYKGKIANDTLHLVLKDDFVYYPFGTFDNLENLKTSQPKAFIFDKKQVAPYKDNSSKKEKIYYLGTKNSYLGAYFNKSSKKYEIVSSIIMDNEMSLKNGVLLGITKEELFKTIKVNPGLGTSAINIVQVESPNKAINHYYRFAGNKLAAIVILSEHFYKVK